MAPVGVIGLCCQDGHGDVAAAQASAMTGVPMTVSTLGNDTLEDVAAHSSVTYRASSSSTRHATRIWPKA